MAFFVYKDVTGIFICINELPTDVFLFWQQSYDLPVRTADCSYSVSDRQKDHIVTVYKTPL